MDRVTANSLTIGSHSHVGSKHLVKFVTALLMRCCGSSSYDLQGDFRVISRLRLRLEYMVLFHHGGVPDVGFKSLEFGAHTFFSVNLRQFA